MRSNEVRANISLLFSLVALAVIVIAVRSLFSVKRTPVSAVSAQIQTQVLPRVVPVDPSLRERRGDELSDADLALAAYCTLGTLYQLDMNNEGTRDLATKIVTFELAERIGVTVDFARKLINDVIQEPETDADPATGQIPACVARGWWYPNSNTISTGRN